jgi:hypothetical protein
MTGTTTNFAIPYPESTDFVTDGATAMETIADKVDDILFAQVANNNLLINGAMRVVQRGAVGTAVTAITTGGYKTADLWDLNISALGTWTQTTIADAPTGSGFRNSLKMACTTADASPAATDEMQIRQKIEGQNLQAIRKGTASARKVTLSFWVKAFQTGTFICELEDADNNRNVSKSYTINASNTWEYKSLSFPADTTGAFDNDANASLAVIWWLGAGSNFTSGTLATTWVTPTTANRAVGQTNAASSTSNTWFMTGASLTVGDVDVPFEFKSYADDLAACQRYFYILGTSLNGASTSLIDIAVGTFADQTTWCRYAIPLPTQMRAVPTFASAAASGSNFQNLVASGGQNATATGAVIQSTNSASVYLYSPGGTVGLSGSMRINNANSFISFSAEFV